MKEIVRSNLAGESCTKYLGILGSSWVMSVQTLPSQLATGFSSCRNQTKFSRTTNQQQAYSKRALQQFMLPALVKPPLENKFL